MPGKTTELGYGKSHQKRRELLAPLVAEGGYLCARCKRPILPGQPWDLGHVDGTGRTAYSGPEHRRCNRGTMRRLEHPLRNKPPQWKPAPVELAPERDGLPPGDKRWDVPWLARLRDVPADAVWPRLMTVPHARAVDSLGAEFIPSAEERSGRPLRWWQRLVATRLLEVDAEGRLVWETVVWTMARQLGKSWLLRELLFWRIHQAERFGEPQDVLHTGKDVAVTKEIQRPVRIWAKLRPGEYKVREVNGQEAVEYLPTGSRWMLRAKEAAYGLTVSVAAVDEAWKVRASALDDGIIPTMVERAQPQLLLVSTAHRLSTTLMLGRRQVALAGLEEGDGDLLIEWSAPPDAALDDKEAWRLASPHWGIRRERLISKQLEALRSGELHDPEEPDPEASFRAQWLNQWPKRLTQQPGDVEDLLPAGLWEKLVEPSPAANEEVIVALEDDFGRGAAVGVVALTEDGRFEVDGWTTEDWDTAIEDVQRLGIFRPVRELHVGASMLDRVPIDGSLPSPRGATMTHARAGFSVFRDLAVNGQIVHDETTKELDEAIVQAQVKEISTGLVITRGSKHLIKAVVWAVAAAHRPARVPAIH